MDRVEPVGEPRAPTPAAPPPPEAAVTPPPPEAAVTPEPRQSSAGGSETAVEASAGASPPAARVAVKTMVLEALAGRGAMTAAEIAVATGTGRATVSSTLTRLARSGEVAKAERGYQLPGDGASATPPAAKRADKPTRATSAGTRSRTAPGATKANILAALSKDQAATSGEVATATGIGRGTVSTTLSRLVKTGEVVKAERGYVLPS